jgi:tetratricopeptide (TPR) repeat protein
VIRDKPDFALAYALMGRVMLVNGQTRGAVNALRTSVEQSGGDPSYRAVYAAALAAAGLTDSAAAVARAVESSTAYVPFTELAAAYVYLNEDDKALALFERAFEERDPAVKHMRVEPLYDRIREHPRFQAILRKAGHP